MCYEALVLLKELGHQVCLEEDLNEGSGNDSSDALGVDVLTDLGDDRYTVGRPHPMIDFRTRCERIVQEASRPEVGVLLLDVILGYGAHPDPAAELAPAMEEAQRTARSSGRELACVVSMCGAPDDAQGISKQQQAFVEAGAIVAHSNALAVRIASAISRGDTACLSLE